MGVLPATPLIHISVCHFYALCLWDSGLLELELQTAVSAGD